MEFFVDKDSVVRKIWGKADTVLFIFAGASAEFALNKAVDWLYYTGRLPADPLGRLFSTVDYARQIVFSERNAALQAIDRIAAIHSSVEKSRGDTIPDWAYRDVLYMLIGYSISAFEVLERKLPPGEKEEVFHVFYRVGARMGLKDLPLNYNAWLVDRQAHLQNDLVKSSYTADLYRQYKKHLGFVRFRLLKEGQKLVCPSRVIELLQLGKLPLLKPVIVLYKLSRLVKADGLLKAALMPPQYKAQIKGLEVMSGE